MKIRLSLTLHLLLGVGSISNAQNHELTDHYGDPLPPGAIARLGTLRLRFGGEVGSAAVSPDGTILIAHGRMIDAKTGKDLPQFKGQFISSQARFSDDLKIVEVGTISGVERWDLAMGK